ncbi:MAG: hypothetical protein HYS80_02740 [Candidatus Aenigmarchaeota archaeon]|nr:hypothetical protein [Candidatus Aenigmarchaeota archaeon]
MKKHIKRQSRCDWWRGCEMKNEEGMIVKLIDAGSRLPIANLNVSLTLLIDCDSELKCGDIRFLSERKSDEGGKFVIFKNEVKDVPNIPNTYLVLDLGSPEFKSKQLKLLEIEKLQEIVIDNYPACNLDEECQDLACGSRTRFHPMPIPKCVRNFCKCTFDQS